MEAAGAAALLPPAAARWTMADAASSPAWVARASAVAARWSACALGELVSGVGCGCVWVEVWQGRWEDEEALEAAAGEVEAT